MPDPSASPNVTSNRETSTSSRLVSLDVLRGFDMFWIMGADALGGAVRTLGQKLQGLKPEEHPHGLIGFFAEHLEHVDWAGFRFYDLIFPLFVFVAGVSIVFSLSRAVETHGAASALARVFRRGLLLYLLGIFYYGGFSSLEGHSGTPADLRLLGVLQRIAICYMAAGALFVWFRARGLVAALVLCLVGYWALLTFVPVPGFGAGNFAEGKNLTNWFDKEYLPFRMWDGDHDPEGILSTLPAIGSCLLGVLAGIYLKSDQHSPTRKALHLAVAGIACIGLGYLWAIQFPIIKKLWTSSFVLVAGGWSLALLGLFYYIVDVRRWRAWCTPFLWIGMNAIFVYMASNLVSFDKLALRLTGGDLRLWFDRVFTPGMGGFVTAIVGSLLCILLARVLYRRNAFFHL